MGMDLIGAGLSYNWANWKFLIEQLDSWGVDVGELKLHNDGDRISRKTCLAIADAIEGHLDEMSDSTRELLEPDIATWRACRGCGQW